MIRQEESADSSAGGVFPAVGGGFPAVGSALPAVGKYFPALGETFPAGFIPDQFTPFRFRCSLNHALTAPERTAGW
jgi:hypothetical protein